MDKTPMRSNPIFAFLYNFFNMMILNWLFILTCIPIITIGAALTSLSDISMQMIKGHDPYIIKNYFKSFRNNFKQSTLLWLPMMFLCIFIGSDFYVIFNVLDKGYNWLQFPVWILTFITASILLYAFPIMASFKDNTKNIVKNSILISISNIPTTIFMFVLIFIPLDFAIHDGTVLVVVGSLLLFFGFAGYSCFYSLFINRIFDKIQDNTE